ncbi:MAG: glycosyltransferase family 39 protein [Campylobacterota bacterium]|nr:glycosyltransferase family 39 protein [Campylobacterota bacterium]
MLRKIWMPLFLLLGVFYLYLIHVKVDSISHISPDRSNFTLHSNLSKPIKLHIRANKFNFKALYCNDKSIPFASQKWKWHDVAGEEVVVDLQKGQNRCSVVVDNRGKKYNLELHSKGLFIDFIVLFILLGIPMVYIASYLFIGGLNRLSLTPKERRGYTPVGLSYIIIGIIFIGLLIRTLYLHKYGVTTFQHDWHGHIEMIKYIAMHWSLPVPDEGLQYPQQPLYYYITASLFWLLQSMGFNEKEALFGLGYISLIASALFLIYAYRLFRVVGLSQWSIRIAMLFLALTPSFVYMSARINNDALVMGLASMALYYLFASYQSGFRDHFYKTLIVVSLLFMTKISTAGFELLFFIMLIITYLQANASERFDLSQKIERFALVGLFLLAFTLFRLYLPLDGSFHMVNSSNHFPGQILPPFNTEYFFSFHITELIQTAQSHVLSMDSIRFSLPTYFYGTMLFGEFDYAWFRERIPELKSTMQFIYLTSILFVIGAVAFVLSCKKQRILYWLIALLMINFLLIIKFLTDYTVVCNSDFRYFVPSFVIVALLIAEGLSRIDQPILKTLVRAVLGLWITGLIYFYALILSL